MKLKRPFFPSVRETGAPSDTAWADKLLEPRDAFLDHVADALQGLVGFDNLNQELRILTVRDEVPVTVVAQKIHGAIIGATLLLADVDDYAQLLWRGRDMGRGTLEVIFHTVQADPVRIAVILHGN